MNSLTRCFVLAAATLTSLTPANAIAQTASNSFEQLQNIVSTGQIVVVTDDTGRKIKGKIASISGSSLVIQSTDRLIFAESAVTEVRRTDSLWNGTLIGAGVGFAVFAIGRLNCEANQWNCGAARGAENWIPGSPVTGWLGPLAGGIAGALLDRARGNNLIYRGLSHASRPSVSVSPVLGQKLTGVSLLMQF